jgi:hypothetical protein
MPRAMGGTDRPENLRTLCKPCHRARQAPGLAPEPTSRPAGPVAPWPLPTYMAHWCQPDPAKLAKGRGNTSLGWWDGPPGTCPPGCPRAPGRAA